MDGFDAFHISRDLYGFAFAGLPAKILYSLKAPEMCYIVYPNNIDHYLKMLIHDQPTYIFGMGTYSGVDQDAIRIETVTKNQFHNDTIEEQFPKSKTLLLQPFVKEIYQTKFASALGNSWCNLVSWKIARQIEKDELQSKYTFLHIPKSFSFKNSVEIIETMINASR